MHCWIFQHEALGFEFWWEAPAPDDLPCACVDPDGYHTCVYDYLLAMCALGEGHAGDHEFVHQDEIMLTFAEASDVA